MPVIKGDKCLIATDSWEDVKHYLVEDHDDSEFRLREFDDVIKSQSLRTIPVVDQGNLFRIPYRPRDATQYEDLARANLVRDLASSIIRSKTTIAPADLLNSLRADRRLSKTDPAFIEGCIRSCIASQLFSVSWDRRTKKANRVYLLGLSEQMIHHERQRAFVARFAEELTALSDRIGLAIGHTGTVGTYREQLLQSLLRRNLPERYHVATGFIHGCPRQIDILIYDRVDYAPTFREADLVVVPREAVRAVIEVKTSLTKAELQKSITLMDQLAELDDLTPPFFRGIFAFSCPLKPDDLHKIVVEFFTLSPEAVEEAERARNSIIYDPFRHLTCVCVLGHSYAVVDYLRDAKNQFTPSLVALESATQLNAQAAYFLDLLQAHLRYEGLKAPQVDDWLGADTTQRKISGLTQLDTWGAYFAEAEIDGDRAAVSDMENHIQKVKLWLKTGIWS
ncbi:DUF6602 domain-containing protein [Arenimonas sp. MALMAid1274]|uniref:DUF6602 domain-containing protein n=1 Tax=Arenimonas sp. MALMAid1274 TaxID=3411630 RepID=UPI003BA371FD